MTLLSPSYVGGHLNFEKLTLPSQKGHFESPGLHHSEALPFVEMMYKDKEPPCNDSGFCKN